MGNTQSENGKFTAEQAQSITNSFKKYASFGKLDRDNFSKAFEEVITTLSVSNENLPNSKTWVYANKRDGPHKLAMWSLFDLFDTSGDGKINIDELILGLSMHCYGTMEQKAELCFHAFDLNHDGFIEKHEFSEKLKRSTDWLIELKKRKAEARLRKSQEKNSMKQISEDLDIDVEEELENFYEDITNIPLGEFRDAAIEKMTTLLWKTVDDNKDSRISLDEWMKHAPENPMIQRLLLLSNQEFQEKQKKEQNLKSSGSLNL